MHWKQHWSFQHLLWKTDVVHQLTKAKEPSEKEMLMMTTAQKRTMSFLFVELIDSWARQETFQSLLTWAWVSCGHMAQLMVLNWHIAKLIWASASSVTVNLEIIILPFRGEAHACEFACGEHLDGEVQINLKCGTQRDCPTEALKLSESPTPHSPCVQTCAGKQWALIAA